MMAVRRLWSGRYAVLGSRQISKRLGIDGQPPASDKARHERPDPGKTPWAAQMDKIPKERQACLDHEFVQRDPSKIPAPGFQRLNVGAADALPIPPRQFPPLLVR